MSPEEMLLDPLQLAVARDDMPPPRRPIAAPSPAATSLPGPGPGAPAPDASAGPQAASTVPPVRTIVLDRPPQPVAASQDRQAIRAASSAAPSWPTS